MPQAPGQPAPAPGQPQTKSTARFGIDPRVMDYLTYISNPASARTMSAMAHDAAAGGRHSALLGAAAGIARGLAQTGTLFGKAPSAEPFAHQMEGYQKDTDQLTQQMLAQGAARQARNVGLDQRVLDYMLPKQGRGAAAQGKWITTVDAKGKTVQKFVPNIPGVEYAKPESMMAGRFYQGFDEKGKPAWVRRKPDGTTEAFPRDPGTMAIVTEDENGQAWTQIVPRVPTVPQEGAPPSYLTPVTPSPGAVQTPLAPPSDKGAKQGPQGGYPRPKSKGGNDLVPVPGKDPKTGEPTITYTPKSQLEGKTIPGKVDNVEARSDKELSDRYHVAVGRLDDLKGMIDQGFRFSPLSPRESSHQRNKIDMIVNMIADEYAKFVDPKSVNRPSEVENAKKLLAPLLEYGGWATDAGKAKEIVDLFKSEMTRRMTQVGKDNGLWYPGKSVSDDTGQTPKKEPPKAPLPMPKSKDEAVVGQPYKDSKGFIWEWTGKAFKRVQEGK
jgi:hypothetical protein